MKLEIRLRLDAAPDRVFRALTTGIANWWGPPHVFADDPVQLVLEPRLGGYLRESGRDGREYLHGQVSAIQPDALIEVRGAFGSPDPLPDSVRVELKPDGAGTTLTLVHRFGGADRTAAWAPKWDDLLKRLQLWVESGIR